MASPLDSLYCTFFFTITESIKQTRNEDKENKGKKKQMKITTKFIFLPCFSNVIPLLHKNKDFKKMHNLLIIAIIFYFSSYLHGKANKRIWDFFLFFILLVLQD